MYERCLELFGDGLVRTSVDGVEVITGEKFRFFVVPLSSISGNPIEVGGAACPDEDGYCTYDTEFLYIACRGVSNIGTEVKEENE